LLRYILHECSEDKVELSKEISLISNYLELEKIRYDKRLRLSFQQDVKNPMVKIAPMILFTFIENCFKHGSSKDAGSSFINIRLIESEGVIRFSAKNSVPPGKKPKKENKGLGLNNVKKRLSHLYPERYELSVKEDEKEFIVELILQTIN
jgi:LytS/YehU family sensor histidine kinase